MEKNRTINVKKPEEILEKGLKLASEEKLNKYFEKKESYIKVDAVIRMRRFSETIRSELVAVEKAFPDFYSLSPFHVETIKTVYDLGEIRKAIASLKGAAIMIRRMEHDYGKRVYSCPDVKKAGSIKKEFFGRASSFVKRNGKNLALLKELAKFMQKLPAIKDEFTVIIAGFPNVGKSTMLSRLTGSTPEIRNYPFTTKSVMIGYMKIGYSEIQFIDTPGILDKRPEKRNDSEKRAVAALKNLANTIIYVADPSEGCGYSLKEQEKLLKVVKEEFPNKEFICLINKVDSSPKEAIEEARAIFRDAIECGYGLEEKAREELIGIIKKNIAKEEERQKEKLKFEAE